MNTEILLEVKTLREQLTAWSHAYYVLSDPAVSDDVFDKAFQRLQYLESQYPELVDSQSPTQSVGKNLSKHLQSVQHKTPMLSISTQTGSTEQDIERFDNQIRNYLTGELKRYEQNYRTELAVSSLDVIAGGQIEYVAEPKYDGLAVNLVYLKGKLVSAATRGDGMTGENVTANVLLMDQIPKKIDFEHRDILEIRGEIYMAISNFDELNKIQLSKGLKLYVNPRNAASGLLRKLQTQNSDSHLKFFGYSIGYCDSEVRPKTQMETLELLKQLGFPVATQLAKAAGVKELVTAYDALGAVRDSLGFEIDGIVFKVNCMEMQRDLGFKSREPRWAVAHKYPAREKTSTVESIEIQVGRKGRLTPVAKITPVFVGGVTVSSITLHNWLEARRKNVRVGDQVIVRRAGDVIPEIVKSLALNRSSYVPNFKIPKKCPECGSPVVREKGYTDYKCTGGLKCPAQKSQAIVHFCSRLALNVKGLGEAAIEGLIAAGLVNNFADLFRLTVDQLSSCEALGKKNSVKVLDELNRAKKIDLNRFLIGLGISGAGEGTSRNLANHFHSLQSIRNATIEDLVQVKDIDESTATKIRDFFSLEENIRMIDEMLELGVQPQHKSVGAGFLSGKSFCITGSFSGINRDAIKERLIALGASISSGVSLQTTYLVYGESPGSKLDKANALGVKVINESGLLEILSGRTPTPF